jgi:hypothetical protein
MHPASQITWTPDPLSRVDISLMELAIVNCDKRGSLMLNRCSMYIQVISVLDLLIFGKSEIHPLYMEGEIPPSRTSIIL